MDASKTNVARILDKAKIEYIYHTYAADQAIGGTEVAAAIGESPERVFKTLVTAGKSGKNYVFVIPVNCELELKKAASVVSEKSIEMIKNKDLLPTTGYIHGGCSPIGMKKPFWTVVHSTAREFERIIFSAGKIGYQVELSLEDMAKVVRFDLADIAV